VTRIVPPDGCRIERDSAVEAKFMEQLSIPDVPDDRPAGFRLNDLVFPRKAAFERQVPDEEDEPSDAIELRLRDLERQGFRGTLQRALRFGIPGAFQQQPVALRTLVDRMGLFRDVPTIMRVSKFRDMVDRDRLPQAMGHYVDRLAFECALSGHDRGRLVVYYEILGEKFMVYDLAFRNMPAVLAEADRRLGLLESGAPPSALPACPSWMAKFCRYRDRCGCGDAA
jgi:hypothetical protein